MSKLTILIFIMIMASCGNEDGTYNIAAKLGTAVIRCDNCELRAEEKTILREICGSFETKIQNFRNLNPEFEFSIQGKNCTGGIIASPSNKLFMNLNVSNSTFALNVVKTTASDFITEFESHDLGLLKELCSIKNNNSIKSQKIDGDYLFQYEFHNTDVACGNTNYRGNCFSVSMSKKTLAGQYLVKKSEVLGVVKDIRHQNLEGVIHRREKASQCFDEINNSTITQSLDQIN